MTLVDQPFVLSGLVLLLLVVGDLALRAVLRRRARHAETRAASTTVVTDAAAVHHGAIARGFRFAVGPLTLLLWVHGIAYVASTLLGEVDVGRIQPRLVAAVDWLRGVGTLVALLWLLGRLGRLAESLLREHAARTARDWDDVVLPIAGSAVRLMLPLVAVILAAPALEVSPGLRSVLQAGISIALIGIFAFLLLRAVNAICELLLARYRMDAADNLQARAVHTQVTVLRKVIVTVIVLFAAASMLMVFEPVRRFGTTLLASAGVAGIILGFAAQKSIATLLAGFQIALTQPIRIDDVVIVEGEWGRIEEITLTYVVVAIWDQRRLVVPINYFIEKPFQNWTRNGSNILGTVMLYVDYGVPIAEMRAELDRAVSASKLWDGRVKLLQVTETKESTVELRVLLSAGDAGKAFDLRCEIREHLVQWLQRHHPGALPRLRAELTEVAA